MKQLDYEICPSHYIPKFYSNVFFYLMTKKRISEYL